MCRLIKSGSDKSCCGNPNLEKSEIYFTCSFYFPGFLLLSPYCCSAPVCYGYTLRLLPFCLRRGGVLHWTGREQSGSCSIGRTVVPVQLIVMPDFSPRQGLFWDFRPRESLSPAAASEGTMRCDVDEEVDLLWFACFCLMRSSSNNKLLKTISFHYIANFYRVNHPTTASQHAQPYSCLSHHLNSKIDY
jgi:hypothetical protein